MIRSYYAVQFNKDGRDFTFIIDRKYTNVAAVKTHFRQICPGLTSRVNGVFRITAFPNNLLVRPLWAIIEKLTK